MTGRTICCGNKHITLYYASMADKKLIYDMGREEQEIFESMFYGECESQPWEEYEQKNNEFYTGEKGKNNYLLIEHNGEVVGAVSHSYNQAITENMEIDIWLRSTKYTGKGLGTQTITLLTDYLNREYSIKTFIIRPSKENSRAIRCYTKSGFTVLPDFNAQEYYGADVGEWGDGDYGIDGTLNMIKIYP